MGKTDFGPPDYREMIPPIVQENYGKWKSHTIPRPGVLRHVSESGAVLTSVRIASPRLVSTDFVREICELADRYCDGYVRFTTRHNVEFLLSDEQKVQPLVDELAARNFMVGGTGNAISNVVHTQGWIHCKSAVTDASGLVKSMMDELHPYFTGEKEVPAKLRIAVACCVNMCGACHCSDIAIVGIHRTLPRVNHEMVSKSCEIPTTVASCPTGAIRPNPRLKSIDIVGEKCMYCGNCAAVCPAIDVMDPENDGVSIWVGGKLSNARTPPKFSRLAIPYLPNNPPRWPEVTEAVNNLVEVWRARAKPGERMGEWIDRIGWERFFQLTGIPFTAKHIDDFTHATTTFRATTQFRF
jgi:sulfite reductase beta subunit